MAWRLAGTKPLSEPVLEYCLMDIGSKLQWNLNRNLYIFTQENVFENGVWKMAAIYFGTTSDVLSPKGSRSLEQY